MDGTVSPEATRERKARRPRHGQTKAAPDAPAVTLIGSDRRRELRERPVSGSVAIDGIPYEIFDWSSSGICVRGYSGDAGKGLRKQAQVYVALPEQVFDFTCELILLRVDAARKLLACVFAALPRPDRVAVAAHFEALEAAADLSLKAALAPR